MIEKDLENELTYLEISVEKLKRMVLNRKHEKEWRYRMYHCTDTEVKQICNSIRKSSLIIKNNAHLVGKQL